MKVLRVCDCGNESIMQHYPQIAKIGEKVIGVCEGCGKTTVQTLKPVRRGEDRGIH